MKRFIKQLKEGFLPILDVLIPRSKDEKWIFWIFFFVFACFSVLFFRKYGYDFPSGDLLNYDIWRWIHDFSRIEALLPFRGGIRHPLLTPILSPLIVPAYIINLLSGKLVLHVLFLMLAYNVIAALSVTIIYKYGVHLIQISKTHAFVLCVLFALFAHCLLLSFVPETFQLSMLGLLIVVYLTTDSLLNHRKIPLATNILLFVYVSGVTVSNGAKCVISQLFQHGNFKEKCKSVLLSGLTALALIILSFFTSYIILSHFKEWDFYNNIPNYIFAGQVNLISEMFFEPILFHHNYPLWGAELEYEGIIFSYNTIFPTIVNIVLYAVLLCAVLVNIRKRAVLLLLSFVGVDVFIHIICGFGISAPYVYCLHWLFIFPLLIGWLYKVIRSESIKTGLTVLILLLSISLAINNIPRILELIY